MRGRRLPHILSSGDELSKVYKGKNKELRLVEHKIALERSYPDSFCELKRNVLTWWAQVRPTALSRYYKVRIVYDERHAPRIIVYGESLRKLASSDFPHKYDIDPAHNRVRVCLFLPSELDYMKPFSETLVPWAIEWLFHYEIWLATGEWHGGGVHSLDEKRKQMSK